MIFFFEILHDILDTCDVTKDNIAKMILVKLLIITLKLIVSCLDTHMVHKVASVWKTLLSRSLALCR